MRILIVEDQEAKAGNLKDFISSQYSDTVIDIAQSYQSGVEEGISGDYDLLLLDMTLPNFDRKPGEEGGITRMKGGQLIIEELVENNISFKCAVVTQYETFDNETIEDVDSQMKDICGDCYYGYVKYNNSDENWKEELKIIIDKCFQY